MDNPAHRIVLTQEDEQHFLTELRTPLPYGVALWPASIALAHELIDRAGEVRGRRVLELGAGTGLAGIVAASLGARVVQTDRQEKALHLCRVSRWSISLSKWSVGEEGGQRPIAVYAISR